MKDKLIIRNFGPIKSIELDLRRINMLIGEQATGKSTVAKVLAVCRYFSYIVNDNGAFNYPVENHFGNGLRAWGLDEFLKPESYIRYECEHYTLVAKYEKVKSVQHDEDGNEFEYEEILFLPSLNNYSGEFENLLKELDKIKPKSESGSYDFSNLFWTIPTSFFQNDVAAVMDNPFYLPTERGLQSIFSLGKSTIPNISDSLYNQFAKMSQIATSFKKEISIEPLGVSYKNENGRGYIKKNNESDFFNLADSASGYQSAIPIILITKFYSDIRTRGKTFIIEEPELNLFPTTQYSLVQYLVSNSNYYGNPLLLTTHSPYILTSLNNLMYAYQVGQKHKEKSSKIIEEKYWINQEDVSAYQLFDDGTCKDILDRTEGLIEADKIDEVSRIINKEFDDLMNIEFEKA